MSVIRTDEWLVNSYDNPIELCEKLTEFFAGVSAPEIYDYLTVHGMYRPYRRGMEQVEVIRKNKVWEIAEKEQRLLRKLWGGPNVPIFIFPADSRNRKIKQEFNGKSGLAFKDKLFLFVSEQTSENELKALLTHEYNHVCRLCKFSKKEADYVLLDTIILEGLAENAVRERFGTQYQAGYTSYYSNDELEKMWQRLILPNRNIRNVQRQHHELLYGMRLSYPKMLGYCVGYYLVKKYVDEKGIGSKDLLVKEANEIAQI
ncbi:MAG TPA: DUF2268 domain-containing protein [Bacillus bacterium]|nr:DUF2268 domain-containing protein [Bacillus sp. (in: firmicutes)]